MSRKLLRNLYAGIAACWIILFCVADCFHLTMEVWIAVIGFVSSFLGYLSNRKE